MSSLKNIQRDIQHERLAGQVSVQQTQLDSQTLVHKANQTYQQHTWKVLAASAALGFVVAQGAKPHQLKMPTSLIGLAIQGITGFVQSSKG